MPQLRRHSRASPASFRRSPRGILGIVSWFRAPGLRGFGGRRGPPPRWWRPALAAAASEPICTSRRGLSASPAPVPAATALGSGQRDAAPTFGHAVAPRGRRPAPRAETRTRRRAASSVAGGRGCSEQPPPRPQLRDPARARPPPAAPSDRCAPGTQHPTPQDLPLGRSDLAGAGHRVAGAPQALQPGRGAPAWTALCRPRALLSRSSHGCIYWRERGREQGGRAGPASVPSPASAPALLGRGCDHPAAAPGGAVSRAGAAWTLAGRWPRGPSHCSARFHIAGTRRGHLSSEGPRAVTCRAVSGQRGQHGWDSAVASAGSRR